MKRMVEVVVCDACVAKGEESTATTGLTIGEESYDLCDEHADRFAGYFRDALRQAVEDRREVG